MKETKNVSQLRFSGFDDDWEEKSFSEITYISATKNKSNLPLESYSITNENGFIPQDEQFENGGTMKDADKKMYWIVPPKSFGYNPARINVGSIGYYDGKKDVIVSSLYEIFKMTENCDDAFFWQWFKSDNLQKQVLKLQEGGVRLYFYYDKLCMGEIKIPSKSEQQKVGTFLSHIDSLIQAKTKKLESLKAVKKSLLQKCFPKAGEKVPKMRFAGFSGEWEEMKLGEVCEINPSSNLPSVFEYVDLESVLGSEMIYHRTEFKNNAPSRAQRLAKKVDVFYQTVRPYQKNNYLFELDFTNYVFSTGYAQLRPKEINSKFLMCQIQSDTFVNMVLEKCTGTSYPAINSTELSGISLLVSNDFIEQQKIGHFFSKYDSLISAQQKEIDKLKDIKKSLLQKMFV